MAGAWVALLLAAAPTTPPIEFREVAGAWGVDFRHHHGGTGQFYMVETMGSGVVVFDYDDDGDEDLFFVDSGATPGYAGEAPRSRLFRNDGAGRWSDRTAASAITVAGYGMGAAAADVDDDGALDLYVTAFGPDQLWRNRGDGSFEDVTARSGIADDSWGSSAAFADPDRDGDLDLYVADYLRFSYDHNPPCGRPAEGLRSYCSPEVYEAAPDRFWRNLGRGHFEDATAAAGFAVDAPGAGMGAIWSDLDRDGDLDLYVTNDLNPNFLFEQQPDGSFREIALAAGVALGPQARPESGMGVDAGDVDGDGLEDLFVTNLDFQTNALYSNLGRMTFVDARHRARLALPSVDKVGFGAAFGDFDHDGDLDLLVANGHILHNVERFGTGVSYQQPKQVLRNDGQGRFSEETAAVRAGPRVSRGLALGDLDGDGDLDAAVNNNDQTAEILENISAGASGGGWLLVDLRQASGNRFALGARADWQSGARRASREVRAGSSYQSQHALGLHFGAGHESSGRLRVRWPDGTTLALDGLRVGSRVRLTRGSAGDSKRSDSRR